MKLNVKDLIGVIVAGIINAIGISLMLVPLSLFDSGISGTSFLLSEITPISLSLWLIILNVPFYILALKKLGKEFVIYSLIAIFSYSIFSYFLLNVANIDFSQGSPFTQQDMLLSALLGGCLSGCGSGLVIRFNGAIDGVDVVAVLFAKKLGLSVGQFVMIYNILLYIVSALVLDNWILSLYSIVTYAVGIKMIDFIVEGLDKAKAVYIITDKEQEQPVAEEISKQLGRGVTVIPAQGFYSQADKSILLCIINRFEVTTIKRIVALKDSSAFVTISDVSETLGGKEIKFSTTTMEKIKQ